MDDRYGAERKLACEIVSFRCAPRAAIPKHRERTTASNPMAIPSASVFQREAGAAGQFPVEFALGPFDGDFLPFDLHLHLRRNGNRLFSNS